MRAMLLLVALAAPLASHAGIYKCTGEGGKITFSDRPCAGAVESTEHQVVLSTPAPVTAPSKSRAQLAAEREEEERYRYVELPRIEREAQALMASGDPRKVALGKEMAWKVHQARETYEQLDRTRAERAEIDERYDRAIESFRQR